MKKSLIALAVLGALGSSAFAQSNVTLYGIADAGISVNGDNIATFRDDDVDIGDNNTTRLDSGIQSGSRLGVRGSESLGNGVDAVFQLEMGVNLDTGASAEGVGADGNPRGTAFGRLAYVGVDSNWGRLTMGRQYSPYFLTMAGVADPFAAGLAGKATNLMYDGGERVSDTIKYELPNWGGFSAQLLYGFGERAGDIDAGRTYGGSLGYANGPVAVKLAYHSSNTTGRPGEDDPESILVGANYDFNIAKAYLAYANTEGFAVAESRDLLAGVTVPFGQSNVMLSYVRKDDRSGFEQDARQWGVGYTYNLSKRTNLYTSYAEIENDNGAGYTVGNATNDGTSEEQFNLGVRHTF